MQLEKEISNLQRQRHQLEFVLESHAARCRHMVTTAASSAHSHVNHVSQTAAADVAAASTPPAPVSRCFAASVKGERAAAEEDRSGREGARSNGRPSTLALSTAAVGASAGSGVTTTPMTFASLGLDCMVDGHTGLTPITGAPSYAASAHRPAHDGDDNMSADTGLHNSEAGMSPTTLMTL